MKPTELMIGDWVQEGKGCRCLQVMQLQGLLIDRSFDTIMTTSGYDNDKEILPIPLTEEILKLNGFVDGVLPYTLCNSKLMLSMQDCNGFWTFSIYAEETEFCDLIVAYVHELQHVLRVCGLKEFADNFKIY